MEAGVLGDEGGQILLLPGEAREIAGSFCERLPGAFVF
jgi:hypothetical protein